MGSQVFDVDLIAFERGNDTERKSIVNGVMRSLETGFVYSAHDISQNFLDDVYGKLDEFFAIATSIKLRKKSLSAIGEANYMIFNHKKVIILLCQNKDVTFYITFGPKSIPSKSVIEKIRKISIEG